MAIVIKPITVEVSKPNVFQAIAAKQYDSNSRFLQVTFVNEGEKIPVLPTSKVTINAKRNDGMSDSFFGEVNDDGTATVPVHSWILELAGYVDCDVTIIDSEGRTLTCTKFSLLVEEASNDSDDVSGEEQQNVLSELLKTIETLTPKYSKEDIDPVFANNPWDLIKWVCQYDDPSKYWKIGDYKNISFKNYKCIDNTLEDDKGTFTVSVDMEIFIKKLKQLGYAFCDCSILTYGNFIGHRYLNFGLGIDSKPYYRECYSHSTNGGKVIYFGEWADIGITLSRDISLENGKGELGSIVYDYDTKYPLQIIGFNHDKVTEPYNYGKQKAGITLQLGASRNVYGDTKPSMYEGAIEGLMDASGKYFISPNRVDGDLADNATNWAESGFRIAIQSLFDGTEIAPHIVEVQKYTSQYYNGSNYWSAAMLSNDKVFLPSEWEVFGVICHAPCQEGEQYEFYKDGYSKFIWSQGLLDGTLTASRYWLRSAKGSEVSRDTPNSKSSCSVYLSVLSLDPLSVNYSPSVAMGGSGYIAPCICL